MSEDFQSVSLRFTTAHTNKKLKSPLEKSMYTTSELVKNPPHMNMFFV